MINVILDLNIIFDNYSQARINKFPASKKIYQLLKESDDYQLYISSSSLDNLKFVKIGELIREKPGLTACQRKEVINLFIKDILKSVNIAKTPAYIEIDFEDIEGSQVIASAIAINAQVVTRNQVMLKKYPERAITTQALLDQVENKTEKINFTDLQKQYSLIQPQIEKNMDEVLNSTSFIMGNKVNELEEKLADFVGVKHCIGVSSGTDALLIAMMALGIKAGDEVITSPFTFIATGEMIVLLGAKPVFVDIDPKTYNIDPDKIEQAITSETKAIMPVSLYGQCADFDRINAIADKYQLPVIEDGAQSLGATYKGKQSCSLTTIGCTSFFPSKPLGGFGDSGACFTDDDELAKLMREIRVHGQDRRYHHPRIGVNGRLDTLQAAILLEKMKIFPEEVEKRKFIGSLYTTLIIANCPNIITPYIEDGNTSVYAQYTIQLTDREKVIQQLKNNNIPSAVHYPAPLNQQPALETNMFDLVVADKLSSYAMSLPMHPYLSKSEQKIIVSGLSL